jgi:muramoyltetrapeptide carboxypeptidase
MRPPILKPQDKIALVAPARRISREEILCSLDIFSDWGLEVVIDERLFSIENQFGGDDKTRTSAFQDALNDPEIKAIVAVRGGYGITRIIDNIDFNRLKSNPKWICGYSDVTALHSHIFNFGIESIHSTMPMLFSRDTHESIDSLRRLLFGEKYEISSSYHPLNKGGKAKGRIVGGNLSIINTIIGTSSDVDTSGCILFLEDIDEYLYNIDRMMVHLWRAGKLDNLTGLIIGHMTDMKDNTVPFGKDAYEIIHHWAQDLNIPLAFNFPIGHEPVNMAIPVFRFAELEVTIDGSFLSFED